MKNIGPTVSKWCLFKDLAYFPFQDDNDSNIFVTTFKLCTNVKGNNVKVMFAVEKHFLNRFKTVANEKY